MARDQRDQYGSGSPGVSPGLGGGGGGVIPASGSSSAPPNGTWGKAIGVVYGCALVKGVPLMYRANGTDLWMAQYGFAIGPVASIDGIRVQPAGATAPVLYGASVIAGHQSAYSSLDASATFERPLGDTATATEWSPTSAMGADYRIPFGHVAHARVEFLPSTGTTPPEMKAVVSGFFSDRHNAAREAALGDHWVINDANPADVIRDLIENTRYGLGFPAGTVIVDVGSDGLASSSYETYCDAYSLWIALGVDESVQVADVIGQILLATNSVGFWEGNSFKVVPLGDLEKTANGVTFTPVSTALAIDDDVLILDGESTVVVRRSPLVDTFSSVPVAWSRDTLTRDVELVTAEMPDAASVDLFGMRRKDPVELPCIRTLAHAQFIAKILTERSLYARDVWEFRVNPRAAAVLQVGDGISLTHAAMGITDEILRIIETDEDERGELAVKAVKWLSSNTVTVTTLPPVDDGVPPPVTIIPMEDTEIVHLGVQDGAITIWEGPTWAAGPGGTPAVSGSANLFGGAMSGQGLTGFTSRIFLSLAAGNVMESAFQLDNWVLTFVFATPTDGGGTHYADNPFLFSLAKTNYANLDGLQIRSTAISGANPARMVGTVNLGSTMGTWTLPSPGFDKGSGAHVITMARVSSTSILCKVDDVAVATLGGAFNFGTGNGGVKTYVGTFHYLPTTAPSTDSESNTWTDGVLYEMRMITKAVTPTSAYLDALHAEIMAK